MRRWAVCLGILLTLACVPPSEAPAIDLAAERDALMKSDAALFEGHTEIDTFMSFFADDAVFMPEGAPAARGEAIRAAWEQLLALPGFHLEWGATEAHVAEAADLGYTIGAYELTVEQDGTPMVTIGKYVTTWGKQADGSWKVVVDCFNSDGPASQQSLMPGS